MTNIEGITTDKASDDHQTTTIATCSHRKYAGVGGLSGKGYSTYMTYQQEKKIVRRDLINTHDVVRHSFI